MSKYTQTDFVAKWRPLFQPNEEGLISEELMQAFAQDIADSFGEEPVSALQLLSEPGESTEAGLTQAAINQFYALKSDLQNSGLKIHGWENGAVYPANAIIAWYSVIMMSNSGEEMTAYGNDLADYYNGDTSMWTVLARLPQFDSYDSGQLDNGALENIVRLDNNLTQTFTFETWRYYRNLGLNLTIVVPAGSTPDISWDEQYFEPVGANINFYHPEEKIYRFTFFGSAYTGKLVFSSYNGAQPVYDSIIPNAEKTDGGASPKAVKNYVEYIISNLPKTTRKPIYRYTPPLNSTNFAFFLDNSAYFNYVKVHPQQTGLSMGLDRLGGQVPNPLEYSFSVLIDVPANTDFGTLWDTSDFETYPPNTLFETAYPQDRLYRFDFVPGVSKLEWINRENYLVSGGTAIVAPKYYDSITANATKTDGGATPRAVKEYVDGRPMAYTAWLPNTAYTIGTTVTGPTGTNFSTLLFRCAQNHTSGATFNLNIVNSSTWSLIFRPATFGSSNLGTTKGNVLLSNVALNTHLEIAHGAELNFTKSTTEWHNNLPFTIALRVRVGAAGAPKAKLTWDANLFEGVLPTLPDLTVRTEQVYEFSFALINSSKFVWVNQTLSNTDPQLSALELGLADAQQDILDFNAALDVAEANALDALADAAQAAADALTAKTLNESNGAHINALYGRIGEAEVDIDYLSQLALDTQNQLDGVENNSIEGFYQHDLRLQALENAPPASSAETGETIKSKLVGLAAGSKLPASTGLEGLSAEVLKAPLTGVVAGTQQTLAATDTLLQFAGKFMYLVNTLQTTVRGSVLTGINLTTTTAISASDTVLVAVGKAAYWTNNFRARVLDTVLTGLVQTTAGTPAATDTVKGAFDKVTNFIVNIASTIRGTVLTGLTDTTGDIAATDSVLTFSGKVKKQLAELFSSLATTISAVNTHNQVLIDLDTRLDAAEPTLLNHAGRITTVEAKSIEIDTDLNEVNNNLNQQLVENNSRIVTAENALTNLQTLIEDKAPLISTVPATLPDAVSGAIVLDYDPDAPFYFKTISANTIIKLDAMVNDAPGVGLTIEKTAGTETVTFQNNNQTLAIQPGKTPSTGAGAWDEYFIQKMRDRFKISLEPYGVPTAPSVGVTKLPGVTGLKAVQVGTSLSVVVSWDQYTFAPSYELAIRRTKSPTATAPTLVQGTRANTVVSYTDNGPSTGTGVDDTIERGVTYYYRVRIGQVAGYENSDYVTVSVKIV